MTTKDAIPLVINWFEKNDNIQLSNAYLILNKSKDQATETELAAIISALNDLSSSNIDILKRVNIGDNKKEHIIYILTKPIKNIIQEVRISTNLAQKIAYVVNTTITKLGLNEADKVDPFNISGNDIEKLLICFSNMTVNNDNVK
jgi:ABC-type ATPase involved in cell division